MDKIQNDERKEEKHGDEGKFVFDTFEENGDGSVGGKRWYYSRTNLDQRLD